MCIRDRGGGILKDHLRNQPEAGRKSGKTGENPAEEIRGAGGGQSSGGDEEEPAG